VPHTTRRSPAELRECALKLHKRVPEYFQAGSRQRVVDELRSFLARHATQPAVKAEDQAMPDASAAAAADATLRVGDLVTLVPPTLHDVPVPSILHPGRLGRVAALLPRAASGPATVMVHLLPHDPRRQPQPMFGPRGCEMAPYPPATWQGVFAATALLKVPHLDAAGLPTVPPEDAFTPYDEVLRQVDTAAFAAFAVPADLAGSWGVPPSEQLVAVTLWQAVWKSAAQASVQVQVTNLRIGGYNSVHADLRVFVRSTLDVQHLWRAAGDSGYSCLDALLRRGHHAVAGILVLQTAFSRGRRHTLPTSAAELLALAERRQGAGLPQATTPAGLLVPLQPHQRESLAWMLAEEASEGMLRHLWHPVTLQTAAGVPRRLWYPPLRRCFATSRPAEWRTRGGWLAEAMGLGKTVVTLALILSDHDKAYAYAPPAPTNSDALGRIAAADAAFAAECTAKQLVPSRATLVLAPVSLVAQWEAELRAKCPSLRVARWHDSNRERDPVKFGGVRCRTVHVRNRGLGLHLRALPLRGQAGCCAQAGRAGQAAARAPDGCAQHAGGGRLAPPGAGRVAEHQGRQSEQEQGLRRHHGAVPLAAVRHAALHAD
jgi:hypothetical protein